MGAEYWLRASPTSSISDPSTSNSSSSSSNTLSNSNHISRSSQSERNPKAWERTDLSIREINHQDTNPPTSTFNLDRNWSLRETEDEFHLSKDSNLNSELPNQIPKDLNISTTQKFIPKTTDSISLKTSTSSIPPTPSSSSSSPLSITGVLRARLNSLFDVSLLWEGRLRNCLVSIGVRADLSNRNMPLRGVGMEVMYFGSGKEVELEVEGRREREEGGMRGLGMNRG